MSIRHLGIIMNGVTGRMGYRQHLVRSILAIRLQGGVELADGTRVVPEPLLVGALPIITPHGHVDPWLLAKDAPFADPASFATSAYGTATGADTSCPRSGLTRWSTPTSRSSPTPSQRSVT